MLHSHLLKHLGKTNSEYKTLDVAFLGNSVLKIPHIKM